MKLSKKIGKSIFQRASVLTIALSLVTLGLVASPVGAEGPPKNLVISVGGVVKIDETAEAPITSASGDGWTIEQGFMGIYQLNVVAGTDLSALAVSGDGALSINPDDSTGGGDFTIARDETSGYSIDATGSNVELMIGGMTPGVITFRGGVVTNRGFQVNERTVRIGSDTTSNCSPTGIEVGSLYVGTGDLEIFGCATTSAITGTSGGGAEISSEAGHKLSVHSSKYAFDNVSTAKVISGGGFDLKYTTALNAPYTPSKDAQFKAAYWPWTSEISTATNPLPTEVLLPESTVTEAAQYTLDDDVDNKRYVLQSTATQLFKLSWNMPGSTDPDAIVTGGTLDVLAGKGYRFESNKYADFNIEAGSPVTIKLLPDYGYQYVSGGINGQAAIATTAQDGVASYSFTMPATNLHISAIFEKTEDKVAETSTAISSGTISVPTGTIANGNAQLTVVDASPTATTTAAFDAAAGTKTVGDYLNLGLNEVIYKGTTSAAWETPVTTLASPMTVNLTLDQTAQGYTDYVVLRDHAGTVEAVPTTYDATTGVLTFTTDKFSTYAIAHGAKVAQSTAKVAPKVVRTKVFKKSGSLSNYSLRHLVKVTPKAGDKIKFSLYMGKKSNVKIGLRYMSFKKAGTYYVKVTVKRASGGSVVKYLKVKVS